MKSFYPQNVRNSKLAIGSRTAMKSSQSTRVTQLLEKFEPGDRHAGEQLFADVYTELRVLAARYLRRERKNHTLQPTALVHEAYLKIVGQKPVDWQGRPHFLAFAAQAMRQILVDHARRHSATKRGGDRHFIALDDNLAIESTIESNRNVDLLALEDAMTKLEKLDPRQAQMIELRFFGGLSVEEVAKVMGMSKRSVEREWTMVRAWLRRELGGRDVS
jgi:RNA polymerase sigma-70 factor, ECF subfamily